MQGERHRRASGPRGEASERPALCRGPDPPGSGRSPLVRCPVPGTSSRAKETALRSPLEAAPREIHCWVSFLFLTGKQASHRGQLSPALEGDLTQTCQG